MTQIKINNTYDVEYDVISNSHGSHANNWTIDELETAHQFSIRNKESVKNSALCGCFYCLKIYNPEILTEADFIDEVDGKKTIVCPHCGVDAVIGDYCGTTLTLEFLMAMNRYFFNYDD
jgi:hypothetical protein